MAHIRSYKTPRGHIRWQVMAWDEHRHQRSRSFDNPQGARGFARAVERNGWEDAADQLERRRGRTATGPVPTVAEALHDHIDNLSGITDGTRARYRRIAARIADSRLGDLPVDIVRRDDVNRWVRDLGATLSGKTITNWHGLLHGALERQVELGAINTNPARKTRIGRTERRPMVTLTPVEFVDLLDHIPDHYKPLTSLLYSMGLRFGEATALQVRDLALDDPVPMLGVRRAWKFTNGTQPQLGAPKTAKARRDLVIPSELVNVLRPFVDGRPREAFVFTTPTGRPVRNGDYRKGAWLKALKAANLGKHPRIHDLRHSFTRNQLAAGTHQAVVQYMLGHESIKTTVDTYGSIARDSLMLAAQVSSQAGMSQAYPELEA